MGRPDALALGLGPEPGRCASTSQASRISQRPSLRHASISSRRSAVTAAVAIEAGRSIGEATMSSRVSGFDMAATSSLPSATSLRTDDGRQEREAQPFRDEAGENPEGIGLQLDVELNFLRRGRMLDQCAEPVRVTWQNEPLPEQPADIHLLHSRKSAAARADRHDVVAAEALNGEVQIPRAPIDDRKVHFAAMQPFDEMAAVAFDDPQADPWKGFDASTGEAADTSKPFQGSTCGSSKAARPLVDGWSAEQMSLPMHSCRAL